MTDSLQKHFEVIGNHGFGCAHVVVRRGRCCIIVRTEVSWLNDRTQGQCVFVPAWKVSGQADATIHSAGDLTWVWWCQAGYAAHPTEVPQSRHYLPSCHQQLALIFLDVFPMCVHETLLQQTHSSSNQDHGDSVLLIHAHLPNLQYNM